LRDVGRYEEALKVYEEGLKVAQEVAEVYYIACATAGIGETQRLLGHTERAELLLNEALSQAEEHSRPHEWALFAVRLGIIEYERGESKKAIAILSRSVASLKHIGDKEATARAFFHLAHAFFLVKNYTEARKALAETSRLAEQLGYDGFLSIEGRNAALLLQYAASDEAGRGRYARVLEKVRALDSGRLQAPVEVIGERGAHARPEIAAYAFGEARVLVNDRRIRDAEWRSGRAKELFFYLLCSSIAKTKEQIAVALWPDLSPAKSTSNFHINLFRARHALFPGIVALEEGRYRISDRPGVWFDVAEFLAVANRIDDSARRPSVTTAVLEKAAGLYVGPFLPGIYSEWAEEMRRELESRHLRVLHALALAYVESGDFSKALALFEKIAVIDPYYEDSLPEIERKILARGCEPALLREFKRSLARLRDGDNPADMKRLPAPGR